MEKSNWRTNLGKLAEFGSASMASNPIFTEYPHLMEMDLSNPSANYFRILSRSNKPINVHPSDILIRKLIEPSKEALETAKLEARKKEQKLRSELNVVIAKNYPEFQQEHLRRFCVLQK